MKLSDRLHSWAIKPSHYDDDFPGGGGGLPAGMEYHVFEVADLTIPAGTNWSNGGNPLGSFVIPAGDAAMVSAKFTLETAADPASIIELVADDTGNWATSVTAAHLQLMPGGLNGGGGFGDIGWSGSIVGRAWAVSADIMHVMAESYYPDPFPDPSTLYVYLRTPSGATTADITVVRARAAFLVI